MDREKMIEEMARALADRHYPDGISVYDRIDFADDVEAILSRLDSLGLCVVPKEASAKGPTSSE